MQGPCSIDGNIGMPLQLSGEIQKADKEKLAKMLPNEFAFSFASFRTKPSLNMDTGSIVLPGSGTNTISFQGSTYTLISLRVTKPQHLNFSDNQSNVFLELIATFQNTRPSNEAPYLFILCFPFYNEPSGSKNVFANAVFTGQPMTATASLQDLLTEAKDFISYKSCIPIIGKPTPEIKSLSCCVLVASHSLPLMKSAPMDEFARFYLLPSVYLMDYDTIVEFRIENFAFVPSSIKRGPNGRTYSATVLTSGEQFVNRFSLYSYDKSTLQAANEQQCRPSGRLATNQLKCFQIKPKQDIKSGILLVDPKTGKRMDAYLQEQDAKHNPLPKPDTTGLSMAAILGIAMGGLAALVVVSIVAVYFFQFNGKPPAASGTAVKVKVGKPPAVSSTAPVKIKVGNPPVVSSTAPVKIKVGNPPVVSSTTPVKIKVNPLSGPTGATGATSGPTGSTSGPTGATGAISGPTGATGATSGPTGATGATSGPTGSTLGPTGVSGATGPTI